MCVVNQSYFLLRDSIVLIYDSVTKNYTTFISKVKIAGLYKLKQSTEDEKGFKHTSYKVVAVHRNGTLSIFIPHD